jgi:hypothetical protein
LPVSCTFNTPFGDSKTSEIGQLGRKQICGN